MALQWLLSPYCSAGAPGEYCHRQVSLCGSLGFESTICSPSLLEKFKNNKQKTNTRLDTLESMRNILTLLTLLTSVKCRVKSSQPVISSSGKSENL